MTTTDCPICTYARLRGSWPLDHAGTHCRDCHLSWTSKTAAHCTVCHGHFTSDTAATLHWVRSKHQDPAAIEGLYLGPDDVWSGSADRDPEANRKRLASWHRSKAAA